jgi:CelD/BcsL family acetyltransferase involved in cellulose biosynthesis
MRWGAGSGRGFYGSLYSRLPDAGLLRVFILYADQKPTAALSCLLSGDTVFAEAAGFDRSVDPRHLGKAFYGMVLKWAAENGYHHFDFSSGTEGYKLHFKPQVYPKHRVAAWSSQSGKVILGLSRAVGRQFHRLYEAAIA